MCPPTHSTHNDPNHIKNNQDKRKLAIMSKWSMYYNQSSGMNAFLMSLSLQHNLIYHLWTLPQPTKRTCILLNQESPSVIMLNYINQECHEHQEALLLKSSISPQLELSSHMSMLHHVPLSHGRTQKTPNMRHPTLYMHPTQPTKHVRILKLTCAIIRPKYMSIDSNVMLL